MKSRADEINAIISGISGVKIIKQFQEGGLIIEGSISVLVEPMMNPLIFSVQIYPQYPFKGNNTENIKFFNPDLLEFNHIMGDGSVCLQTAHSPSLSEKLIYDVESLKAWIIKYYIKKEGDTHYEHLIVPLKVYKNSYHAYFFNETDYKFSKNQFGYIDYSHLSQGLYHKDGISNNIIHTFFNSNKKVLIEVKWNIRLKALERSIGVFIFLEDPPSKNLRWTYNEWNEFESQIPQIFLDFLHKIEKSQAKGIQIPMLIGYNISDTEIHWQCVMLETGNFPIHGEKVNSEWLTKLNGEGIIDWAITRNVSYKYFYGRGRLHDKLKDAKILIIGIGAIGSIAAKTLVRSGCIKIDFIDYDIKEPENVCRSEYSFFTGLNNKTDDLITEISLICPFFETRRGGYDYSLALDFFIKSHQSDHISEIEKQLNDYDIIFDCTADNDLLYVLSQLNINTQLINLSISNHATHLVCAAEKNRYQFVTTQFNTVLHFDIEDLYNPTGCWSPTFKASYNDVNALTQFALKHINISFEHGKPLRNFVIESEYDQVLNFKIKEF